MIKEGMLQNNKCKACKDWFIVFDCDDYSYERKICDLIGTNQIDYFGMKIHGGLCYSCSDELKTLYININKAKEEIEEIEERLMEQEKEQALLKEEIETNEKIFNKLFEKSGLNCTDDLDNE